MTLSRRAYGVLLSLPLAFGMAALMSPASAWTTGSGRSATESRPVAPFEAIAAHSSVDLQIRQGDTASLQVTGDDNLLRLLETTVESGRHGSTLRIRWKPNESIRTRTHMQVQIVVPKLSAVSVTGSGQVRLSPFSIPSLQLEVSGSGDVKFEQLQADQLGIAIAGSGDIGGTGVAQRVRASVSGSGDIHLADLRADDVELRIAGSGDARVQAHKTLDVSISGSGDVIYTGDARVESRIGGSGSVKKR